MASNNHKKNHLTALFTPENIVTYKKAPSVNQITEDLLKNLALTYGIGNVRAIISVHKKRRGGLYPVAVNSSGLVQHFRIFSTKRLRMAIAVIEQGMPVKIHSKPYNIRLFFVIVSPKKRSDLYLRTYHAISSLVDDKKFVEQILSNPDSSVIWDLIAQKHIVVPHHIAACDIMVDPIVVIKDVFNLEDAIDLFIKTRRLSIPVIDKDGDLIGEVTVHELMNVCLPRYILWMDEMDPVLNFESFRNLLHKESHTWLEEIMVHDIARVQVNDPAIKAGIEMTKLSADHAYVLEEKKLVGIITVQHFINKVLRE